MRIVITGGIGTGKSTISKALLSHLPGYKLVSADQMVHDLYATNADFQTALLARFGTTDRKTISGIVFADASLRAELIALSWTYLAPATDALFRAPNLIFEFPLYFESPRWVGIPDAVVVLGCDEATQRARVMARDGMSEEGFARVLAAQMPVAEKAKRADIYLDTSGNLAEVLQAVAALPEKLRTLARHRRQGAEA